MLALSGLDSILTKSLSAPCCSRACSDVVRPNQQISITIYDSGAEDDVDPAKRFLGQVKLSPSEVHNRTIDSWFRLQGRETSEHVTGEIRVNIRYLAIEVRTNICVTRSAQTTNHDNAQGTFSHKSAF